MPHLIDKEFISRYEALKDSLKGDLFIAAEIELENQIYEIVIHHENQSKREPMDERVYEYHCYAWLLKRKPVWSILNNLFHFTKKYHKKRLNLLKRR